MRFAYAYLALALLAWLSAAALWVVLHPSPADVSPLELYAPCVSVILGPTPAYDCADNHRWVRQLGAWVDVGANTPRLVLVPQR